MEEQLDQVVFPPTPAGAAEERMLCADLVREIVARAQRGEGAKRIARELGVDRKTVKGGSGSAPGSRVAINGATWLASLWRGQDRLHSSISLPAGRLAGNPTSSRPPGPYWPEKTAQLLCHSHLPVKFE
jgi:hypothetical protein